MFGGQRAVGGQQGERRAARALAEQQADHRDRQRAQLGHAAGDLPGQRALFGGPAEQRAVGVDDGEQRQAQFGGEPHAAPGRAQGAGADRTVHGRRRPVVADHHAALVAEPGQRQAQRVVPLTGSGARQRDQGVGLAQEFDQPRAARLPGPTDGLPDRDGARNRGFVHRTHRFIHRTDQFVHRTHQFTHRTPGFGQQIQGRRQPAPQLIRSQYRVHGAEPLQMLGPLHPLGERLPVQRLVHPWAQEAHQGTGLGGGQLAE